MSIKDPGDGDGKKEAAVLTATTGAGATIGGVVAGPVGAVVGGAVGLVVGAIAALKK